MPAPATSRLQFLEYVKLSGLVEEPRLTHYVDGLSHNGVLPEEPGKMAACFIRDGLLTTFQAQQLLKGRHRNFTIGKYKVLEPLGVGGMSKVFLCEHAAMGHRVALKMLPIDRVKDSSAVGRFQREARAVASLNHPNVVRAHDVDRVNSFIYLVMDYIEGVNLHDFVRKNGPLSAVQASHYLSQASAGLQHIHEAGLVHRDIKPGNLLLDRDGVVRILDLGLARFQGSSDGLTKQFDDKAILGTADYISPEQGLRSSNVDVRSDIYSLGATAYFLLAGQAPFEELSVTQKLLGHQLREPTPLGELRKDLPPELLQIVTSMLAKKPEDRFQEPNEIIEALAPWTQEPLEPPNPSDFPQRGGSTSAPHSSSSIRPGSRSSSGQSSTRLSIPRTAPITGAIRPSTNGTHTGRHTSPPSAPVDQSWIKWLIVGGTVVLTLLGGLALWLTLGGNKS